MRRALLAALLAAAATSAAAVEPCRPIEGLEEWIEPGTVLLLGEIHGTAESPAFAGDVACHVAGAGLPVVVALELEAGGQGRVDAFLASDGGEQARRALLAGPDWRRRYQDGRNSRAILELIERVRRLRRSGARARVVLFDPGTSGGARARDRGMASRLAGLAAAETEAVIVVLTGNLHSRTSRGRPGDSDYEPMGHLLAESGSARRVVALLQAHGGGTAWICSPECGVTDLAGRQGGQPWRIELGESPPPGHAGWYRLGGITASPPAGLSATERQALRLESSQPAGPGPTPPEDRALPAAAPEPRGPLTPLEEKVQGRWQGYDERRGTRTWSLDVQRRGFRAEGAGEWYEGRVVVRGDRWPAWIDFVIERCRCAYEGRTSTAVFDWTDESLLVAAPAPGSPRPPGLEASGAQLIRFLPR